MLKGYSSGYSELLPDNIACISPYLLLNQSIKYSEVLSFEFVLEIANFENNISCDNPLLLSERIKEIEEYLNKQYFLIELV